MKVRYFVELFRPPGCVGCGVGGLRAEWLCDQCALSVQGVRAPHCYRCGALSEAWMTCPKCRKRSAVDQLIGVGLYQGALKQIIDSYKYGKRRMLSALIVDMLSETLGQFNQELIVSFVPSARSRVRERGFDHAQRLAQELARQQGFDCVRLLERLGDDRQVGAEKGLRFKQAARSYLLLEDVRIRPLPVILVDDVVTSGATIEAAALQLKKHPAVSYVMVVCLARNL